MISSNNLITPSPQSKEVLKPSTSKVSYSHYTIKSSLLVFNFASNDASHSSLRRKRRSHLTLNSISIYHPLNREYNNSYFTFPRPSASSNEFYSKENHASTHYLSKTLTVPSIESCTESSASKKETTMNKLHNVSTIFLSSRKRHSTF